MKRISKHFEKSSSVLLALLLCIVFVAGCSNNSSGSNSGCKSSHQEDLQPESNETFFTYIDGSVSLDDPSGNIYQEKYGWHTEYNGVTYQFTRKVPEDTRNTIVSDINKMLSLLENQFGEIDGIHTICICDGSYTPGNYNGVLYAGVDEMRTQFFAAALVQMVYGTDINYGICFALGTELLDQMGYPTEDISVTPEQALTLCQSSPLHLDLNYACFISNYSNEETLSQVKALALDFYKSLTQEARKDLLLNYSNARYCQYLNEYLTSHGQDTYENSEVGEIFFYPSGGNRRLAWEDPYAVFYLYQDYTVLYNQYGVQYGVSDYLNSEYEDIRFLAHCYQLQAQEMERMVGKFETEDKEEKIPVLFIRDPATEMYAAGGYVWKEERIELYSVEPYAHEYVHYLLRDAAQVTWLTELLPCYCTQRPGDPEIFWLWEGARYDYENSDSNDLSSVETDRLYTAVKESLDHPFDWNDFEDYTYMFNAYMVAFDQFGRIKTAGGLNGHAMFPVYLASLVGEEAMMNAVYYDIPSEVFGKSWDELISEWELKLRNDYGWIHQQ